MQLLLVGVIIFAAAISGTRIIASESVTLADFIGQNISVCGDCYPWLDGVEPADPNATVTDGFGGVLAANWSLVIPTSVPWTVSRWYGGRFDCGGWTSSTLCGGGIVNYPNGTQLAEPCSQSHYLLCICDDNNSSSNNNETGTENVTTVDTSNRTYQFAQGIGSLCTIENEYDIYCTQYSQPPSVLFYAGIPPALEVYGGAFNFVAKLLNQTYAAWGMITVEALPDTPDESPIVNIGFSFTTITVLTAEGNVYSIGDNTNGVSFGDGGENPFSDVSIFRQALVPSASKMAIGIETSCALTHNGTVWCWGLNSDGGRGDGSDTELENPFPTQVFLPFQPSTICGNGFHKCVTNWGEDGLWCWGSNWLGESGRPNITELLTPARAIHFDNVFSQATELICGFGLTCLHLQNGSYACTGKIEYGEVEETFAPVTGYAIVFDRFEGMNSIIRDGIDSVCGLTDGGSLTCRGIIAEFPPFDELTRIRPGSMCTFTDSASPYVCGISEIGNLVCVGGEFVDRSNFNFVTAVFPANISRIFCNTYYVYAELSSGVYMMYSTYGNMLFDGNFTLPSSPINTIRDSELVGNIFLCEDNQTYIVILDPETMLYTVALAEVNSTLVRGEYIHLTQFGQSVCYINVTHPHIAFNQYDHILEPGTVVSKFNCGPNGAIGWIEPNGELTVYPGNPFVGIVDNATDIAFNFNRACALDTEGVAYCFTRDSPETDTWTAIPSSAEMSLPRLSRLSLGYGFVCAEGFQGDVWCMHSEAEYPEALGPEGTNPLRIYFNSPP